MGFCLCCVGYDARCCVVSHVVYPDFGLLNAFQGVGWFLECGMEDGRKCNV